MPNNTIATTSEAGRVVASNLQARRQAARREAADTTTPLFPETVGAVPLETLPEPPAAAPAPAEPAEPAKPARSITLATTIRYRDYAITITATGLNLDQFCDMLDKRLGVVA